MRKLSKKLVIDTATNYVYLSLLINNIEVDYKYQEGINNHSVTIIPLLNEVLQRANLTLRDLDEIIVGIGPGSYTGVRIGVSVAKMIGYLNRIPLFTVSSLALMASSSDEKYVLPFIDARRENAFMGLYKQTSEGIICIKNEALENVESYTNGIEEPFEIIKEGKPQIEKIIKSNLLNLVEDVHSLVPNYMQITEAERNMRLQ
ncbi:MAG: tRNA (adenosine(37)-N6)-threonylcarbamoyltransferase complex dimerization subunit type 1 TsaB [Firmicutes bacterium]|nr:tRNA (adenosine(37)-N6)-threonylcarbamoyltransferase complex dimerization subunit type 1 TsaB [Bacillota bacterium]